MSKQLQKKRAPVAIFVYNRLHCTRSVIEALRNNYLAKQTDVFVYSDAPKTERDRGKVQEIRKYLKTVTGFKSFTVIEREKNFYIEKNIMDGVTNIINKYGKIIVLEDDGLPAKNFLTFMNKALDYYEDKKRVMHIGTFTFIDMPEGYNKTFLWRYAENTGGGWGTWKDRWDKFVYFENEKDALLTLTEKQKKKITLEGAFNCLGSLKMDPIPWDICWNIAITKNNGLTVNSPRPLIKNIGLFNGTHFTVLNKITGKSPFEVELDTSEEKIEFEEKIEENEYAINQLRDFYAKLGTRKRDKILHYFMKIMVKLKITKLVKKLLHYS